MNHFSTTGHTERMLPPTPKLHGDDQRVLDELAVMREELKQQIGSPRTWTDLLRRSLTAAAIAGSNSIEGIQVNLRDAEAAVAGEEPGREETQTGFANPTATASSPERSRHRNARRA